LDKCVVWWPKARSFDNFPSSIKRAPVDGIKLLGAPIGTQKFCEKFICKKTAKLARLHGLLLELDDSQIEMCLLRGCLAVCKVNYFLRTIPRKTSWIHWICSRTLWPKRLPKSQGQRV